MRKVGKYFGRGETPVQLVAIPVQLCPMCPDHLSNVTGSASERSEYNPLTPRPKYFPTFLIEEKFIYFRFFPYDLGIRSSL